MTLQEALKTVYPNLRDPCKKIGHPSRGKAEAHVRAMKKRSDSVIDAAHLGVYHCSVCRQWHTGHSR